MIPLIEPLYSFPICLQVDGFACFDSGHSFVAVQLGYSYLDTACITIMLGQICQALCKHLSSLVTWLASATVSSSCLALLVSAPLCSLFVTYTNPSSVNSELIICQFSKFPSSTLE